MLTSGTVFNRITIGHLAPILVASVGTLGPAPITVRCGGDLLMDGAGPTSFESLFITHGGPVAWDANGGVFVSVGGNLTMQTVSTHSSSSCIIGRFRAETLTGPSPIEVAVGGNLTMTGPNTANNGLGIGFGNDIGVGNNTSTNVIVGGDIAISAALPSNGVSSHGGGITSFGDVNVSAGGNITLTCNNGAPTSRLYIGTNDTDNAAFPRTTRICAGGSIIAQNAINNAAFLGRANLNPVAPTFSTDIRASGDIQLAASIITGGPGSIFVSADANLPLAGLWETNGGNLITCCGASLLTPLAFNAASLRGSTSCPATAARFAK